jgi:hypothetical protein
MTNLAPVPSPEDSTSMCSSCGAPLAADQRYCLSCGQPCTPTRLAFLDVLESERQGQAQIGAGQVAASGTIATAYTPYVEPAGPPWLRRYAPIFGVASVLLLALLAGLLLGHWASQGKAVTASGPEIVKVEGLSASAPVTTAASATPAPGSAGSTTTPTSTAKSAASTKSEEAKEQAEAKAEEQAEAKSPAKAPPAKPLDSKSATKLEKSTGKQKEAELNKVTTAPIEVK